VRVAVIDVGSNTARLLVADVSGRTVSTLDEDRAYLQLGGEIARGGPGPAKLAKVARRVRAFRDRASDYAVERADTIVTAPGRHGAASEQLLATLREATGWPVRVLSAEEEGRLAFAGATSRAQNLPEVVAVIDVGGGSSELAVGTPLAGAAWVRSLATGSLRLSSEWLHDDPPTGEQVAAARAAVRDVLRDVEPPSPDAVLATGGTARALVHMLGRRYNAAELDEAADSLAARPASTVTRAFGIHPRRAGTILAGTLVLAEIARLLDRPLEVARGGLREGSALALAAAVEAAA
jgi:exopolyphosphatase / guanosine-5'-triphosphate,3'-diphosphate pyrophosphatase